ncbi:hypothetical protein JMJ55_25645 [Belnapia sp. T6]|uniref:Uncharacterized protein n=1 Tax=Belnapia mucosa TaxID=2804532 RepID=A0ABS1VE93_9PROT|nr:hypothetical protein [Belnapia mucosa]MBL6458723.1 hypothetical protein [Belnapia mucosa]
MPVSARAEGEAALAALDRALAQKPKRDGHAFAEMTEHLCTMRDLLIGHGRERGGPPPLLERLNSVISTALAGHFPLGSTPWSEVEHARGVLQRLIEEAD